MSGIAKPGVKFSTSLTPTAVVNADNIRDVSKLNIGQLPNQPANTAKWGILVKYLDPHAPVAEVYFSTMAARDTAFTSFETLICATI